VIRAAVITSGSERKQMEAVSKSGKLAVVMPAYNAECTLEKTVNDIPEGLADEIILCDDASSDRTVELAKRLGLTVIEHKQNKGYGANQKSCYTAALKSGADIIAMIHPDYQYDPRVLPAAVHLISLDICDVVLGSRIRTRKETLDGGIRAESWGFPFRIPGLQAGSFRCDKLYG